MRNQGLAPDPTNEIVVVDERNRAVRKADHNLIAVAGDDADVLISRAVLEVTVRLAGFLIAASRRPGQSRSKPRASRSETAAARRRLMTETAKPPVVSENRRPCLVAPAGGRKALGDCRKIKLCGCRTDNSD
jgi:hypothetical protein